MAEFDEKIIFDTPVLHRDGNKWCHLVSSDIEYLKQFAASIGLKDEWVQTSAKGYVHFDIKADRIRKLAQKNGAIPVQRKYLIKYLQFHFPATISMSAYPFVLPDK